MKNVKKIVHGMGTAALCACAVAIGQSNVGYNAGNDLLSENIEALTAKEIVRVTTWSCSGDPLKDCKQSCGCGAHIEGNGDLSGSHSCTTIEF